jgi:hypothetical protein
MRRNAIVRELTAENDDVTLTAIAALQESLRCYFKIKRLNLEQLTNLR